MRNLKLVIVLFVYLGVNQLGYPQENNKQILGYLDSFIACSGNELTYKSYIVQYHLKITHPQAILIPDSSLKYEIYFVTIDSDTTFRLNPIEARYLLGYLGVLEGPCYDDTEIRTRFIDGREYWFVLNHPVNANHRAKTIHFKLWANIEIGGEIRLMEFITITEIETDQKSK